jgi:hypothetical protein
MAQRKINPRASTESAAERARIVNWRLLFKVVIKQSILLGRTVQDLGKTVYSEANKVVTEARADLDREHKHKDATTGLGASH